MTYNNNLLFEEMEIYDSLPRSVRDRLKEITPADGDMFRVLHAQTFGGLEALLTEMEAQDKRDHQEDLNVRITGKIK